MKIIVTFEYKVERLGQLSITNLQRKLNDLGKDGWELVALEHDCYIFKREVTNVKEKGI